MSERETLHKQLYDDIEFTDIGGAPEMTPEVAKEFFPIHREPQIDTMDEPVIIECAYPGWQAGGDHYPAVPDGPEETSQELVKSVNAGAAAIHVHPRDERGIAQLTEEELFTRTLDPVFEECGEVLTLSHTWYPGQHTYEDSEHADYVSGTRRLLELGNGNKYCQGALILPPGHGTGAAYHSLGSVKEGVRYFQENNITPLFQLYDTHVIYDLKRHLFEEGEMEEGPYIMNLNLGKHHAHAIHKDPWSYLQLITAMNMVRDTVENSIVNVFPGGRNWLPILVLGLLAGGTVFRVGIEETYWMYPHRDDVIQKNSELIEFVVVLAEKLGRDVITDPDEARDHLRIEYTSPR